MSERNGSSTGDKYPPLARQNEVAGQDLVLVRLGATDDALGADPIIRVDLEAPALAQRHGL